MARNLPSRLPNHVHRRWLMQLLIVICLIESRPILSGAELDATRLPPPAKQTIDFVRDIRPLFADSCWKCHGAEKSQSGLRLDSRAHLLAGGDQGPVIVPGESGKSRLAHYVAHLVPDFEMPPKGKGDPLSQAQVGLLRAWIDQGALWPGEEAAEAVPVDKADWWSLKPLLRPPVPQVATNAPHPRNPIDSFIVAALRLKGLSPSPEADRPTLIRRLYFDLIGLPPTPREIEAFVTSTEPDAYERLVDHLLASPQYGERWARHWLDVVHYGETHGYDKDQPRPNAWPYRDYVIRSLNADKAYGRFIEEQLAGDVLYPETRDGFEALGFISAGPWDLIGHAEVPETKIDGKIARHLDRDDMVATTLQTFNSLTAQCAQCHNHKFDPISQEDYYSLQAVFAAVDRADRKYDVDPATARQRRKLMEEERSWVTRKVALDKAIQARIGLPLVELDRRISSASKVQNKSERFGYHSAIEKRPEIEKWVQVDLGRSVAIRQIVLHPSRDDFNQIGDGFGFPVRYRVEVSDDSSFANGLVVVGDFSKSDVSNPKVQPQVIEAAGRMARFVRVVATRLALRQEDYIFALAEVSVLGTNGQNIALGAEVTSADSIEAPPRWGRANLTDGWYPGLKPGEGAQIAALREEQDRLRKGAMHVDEAAAWRAAEEGLISVRGALEALPPQATVYVGAVHTGSGAFSGTGGNGGQPRPIFLLHRGNVQKPGKEVSPGTLSCLKGLPARFSLPESAGEGARRAALARWLSDANNPLTWRSIVNRVWQYHFGQGLVDTPNDFGHMGGLPSHPELLDWLAIEFREGGQSLKALHRLMVCSATYRQRSAGVASWEKIDADNRYLWRMNRRKLEAEAVRDSVLRLAGKLNLEMGGPSFRDFVIDKPENSPHYEYHLHDPEDPKSHRRSIYRFIVRSQQQPFMTTLDCADPSMQVGRRNESVSPLQALTLLNNAFMLTMSRHFAHRIESGGGPLEVQVRRAYYEAIGQPPAAGEETALIAYARGFGMTNLCRVLLNSNAFAFVD